MSKEAKLIYGDGNFQVLERGDFVICAVTKKRIPLNELKYWSVDKQEPYFDAHSSLEGELSNPNLIFYPIYYVTRNILQANLKLFFLIIKKFCS